MESVILLIRLDVEWEKEKDESKILQSFKQLEKHSHPELAENYVVREFMEKMGILFSKKKMSFWFN